MQCIEAETNVCGPHMPKIASLERLKDFQKTFPYLHPTHHLYFLLLDGLAVSLTDEAAATRTQTQTQTQSRPKKKTIIYEDASTTAIAASSSSSSSAFDRALVVMTHQEELMESDVVPPNHHEKILFFDKIAQLAIAAGKSDMAKSYYAKALSMASRVVSSRVTDWPAIRLLADLKHLSEHTPGSAEELASYYNRGRGCGSGGKGGDGDADDNDWEDVDEE